MVMFKILRGRFDQTVQTCFPIPTFTHYLRLDFYTEITSFTKNIPINISPKCLYWDVSFP